MKLLLVLLPSLCIIISVIGSPLTDSWRTTSDEESNPWRNLPSFTRSRKAGFLGNGDDPSNWRNQKRSSLFGFPRIEFDVKKLPFYSNFEKNRERQKQKNDKKDSSVSKWDGDLDGVINCPPDIPKCIPRLGR